MTTKPSIDEIRAFARRHGLERLGEDHLARMAELAHYVGDLGRTLPRPARKEDAPAPSYEPRQNR